MDNNRQHKRIDKKINMLFSVADVFPAKWDMCVIENISAGGIRFIAQHDLKLFDKNLHLQIRVPELAPIVLKLDAKVVDVKPRTNDKQSDVRAKFINLSLENKEHLTVLEKMIEQLESKIKKDSGKKL